MVFIVASTPRPINQKISEFYDLRRFDTSVDVPEEGSEAVFPPRA